MGSRESNEAAKPSYRVMRALFRECTSGTSRGTCRLPRRQIATVSQRGRFAGCAVNFKGAIKIYTAIPCERSTMINAVIACYMRSYIYTVDLLYSSECGPRIRNERETIKLSFVPMFAICSNFA